MAAKKRSVFYEFLRKVVCIFYKDSEIEGKEKNETCRIKHAIDDDYWRNFAPMSKGGYTKDGFPKCSGVAMGIDRLIMLLCGKSDISLVTSFENDYLK